MSHLPLDIIHGILLQIPDFQTLYAVVSTAKLFRSVCSKSPASIMRSVAENIVGSDALPSAFRLACWIIYSDGHRVQSPFEHFTPKESDVPKEGRPSVDRVLTWKEAKRLQDHAKYATLYEDQFSRRFKNCLVPESVLTPIESVRFRNAFYRMWLYWSLPTIEHDDEEAGVLGSEGFLTDDDDEEEDDDEETVEDGNENGNGNDGMPLHAAPGDSGDAATDLREDNPPTKPASCTQVMDSLTKEEILDIYLVQSFFETFIADVRKRNERKGWCEPRVDQCPFPDWLFDRYLQLNGNVMPRISNNYTPVIQVIQSQISSIPSIADLSSSFFVDVTGRNDVCDHCQQVKGLELRSLDNLNDISCKLGITDIFSSFQGLLSLNQVEKREFYEFLDDNSNLSIEIVLHDIFDLHLPRVGSRWQKEDRICLNCWREILTLGSHDWWLNKKKTLPNYTPKEDCWYGYLCRTQTHRISHAERLNHLCDFTGARHGNAT